MALKRTQGLSPAEMQPLCGTGRHRLTAGQKRPTMGGSIEPPFLLPQDDGTNDRHRDAKATQSRPAPTVLGPKPAVQKSPEGGAILTAETRRRHRGGAQGKFPPAKRSAPLWATVRLAKQQRREISVAIPRQVTLVDPDGCLGKCRIQHCPFVEGTVQPTVDRRLRALIPPRPEVEILSNSLPFGVRTMVTC